MQPLGLVSRVPFSLWALTVSCQVYTSWSSFHLLQEALPACSRPQWVLSSLTPAVLVSHVLWVRPASHPDWSCLPHLGPCSSPLIYLENSPRGMTNACSTFPLSPESERVLGVRGMQSTWVLVTDRQGFEFWLCHHLAV